MDDADYRNRARKSGTAIHPGDAATAQTAIRNLLEVVKRAAEAIRKALKR